MTRRSDPVRAETSSASGGQRVFVHDAADRPRRRTLSASTSATCSGTGLMGAARRSDRCGRCPLLRWVSYSRRIWSRCLSFQTKSWSRSSRRQLLIHRSMIARPGCLYRAAQDPDPHSGEHGVPGRGELGRRITCRRSSVDKCLSRAWTARRPAAGAFATWLDASADG